MRSFASLRMTREDLIIANVAVASIRHDTPVENIQRAHLCDKNQRRAINRTATVRRIYKQGSPDPFDKHLRTIASRGMTIRDQWDDT